MDGQRPAQTNGEDAVSAAADDFLNQRVERDPLPATGRTPRRDPFPRPDPFPDTDPSPEPAPFPDAPDVPDGDPFPGTGSTPPSDPFPRPDPFPDTGAAAGPAPSPDDISEGSVAEDHSDAYYETLANQIAVPQTAQARGLMREIHQHLERGETERAKALAGALAALMNPEGNLDVQQVTTYLLESIGISIASASPDPGYDDDAFNAIEDDPRYEENQSRIDFGDFEDDLGEFSDTSDDPRYAPENAAIETGFVTAGIEGDTPSDDILDRFADAVGIADRPEFREELTNFADLMTSLEETTAVATDVRRAASNFARRIVTAETDGQRVAVNEIEGRITSLTDQILISGNSASQQFSERVTKALVAGLLERLQRDLRRDSDFRAAARGILQARRDRQKDKAKAGVAAIMRLARELAPPELPVEHVTIEWVLTAIRAMETADGDDGGTSVGVAPSLGSAEDGQRTEAEEDPRLWAAEQVSEIESALERRDGRRAQTLAEALVQHEQRTGGKLAGLTAEQIIQLLLKKIRKGRADRNNTSGGPRDDDDSHGDGRPPSAGAGAGPRANSAPPRPLGNTMDRVDTERRQMDADGTAANRQTDAADQLTQQLAAIELALEQKNGPQARALAETLARQQNESGGRLAGKDAAGILKMLMRKMNQKPKPQPSGGDVPGNDSPDKDDRGPPPAGGTLTLKVVKQVDWAKFCEVYKVDPALQLNLILLATTLVKRDDEKAVVQAAGKLVVQIRKAKSDTLLKNANHIAAAIEDVLLKRAQGEKLRKAIRLSDIASEEEQAAPPSA